MYALLPILILAASVLVVWLLLKKKERPPPSTANPDQGSIATSRKVHPSASTEWAGTTYFDFDIVGESNYQKHLSSLAGDHGTRSAEAEHQAELIPEDSNVHDPKAVMVRIEGKTVGYLSRDDARSFRRRLGQKRLTGKTTTCNALIVGGGTRENGEKLFYGVKLDLKPFE